MYLQFFLLDKDFFMVNAWWPRIARPGREKSLETAKARALDTMGTREAAITTHWKIPVDLGWAPGYSVGIRQEGEAYACHNGR
jgi:hypothetical protein